MPILLRVRVRAAREGEPRRSRRCPDGSLRRPVAKRRSRPLGTIPEVHPRDVLVEDEEGGGE